MATLADEPLEAMLAPMENAGAEGREDAAHLRAIAVAMAEAHALGTTRGGPVRQQHGPAVRICRHSLDRNRRLDLSWRKR